MITFIRQFLLTALGIFSRDPNTRRYASLAFFAFLGAVGCAYITSWLGAAGYAELGREFAAQSVEARAWYIAIGVAVLMFGLANFLAHESMLALTDRTAERAAVIVVICAALLWGTLGSSDTYVSYKGAGLRAYASTELEAGRSASAAPLPYTAEIAALRRDVRVADSLTQVIRTEKHPGSVCKDFCASVPTSKGQGSLHWNGALTPFGKAKIKDLIAENKLTSERIDSYIVLQQKAEGQGTAATTDKNNARLDARGMKRLVLEGASIVVYLAQFMFAFIVAYFVHHAGDSFKFLMPPTAPAKPGAEEKPKEEPAKKKKKRKKEPQQESQSNESSASPAGYPKPGEHVQGKETNTYTIGYRTSAAPVARQEAPPETRRVSEATRRVEGKGFPYSCTQCGEEYFAKRPILETEKPFCCAAHRAAWHKANPKRKE